MALHGLQTAIERAVPAKPRLHPDTKERIGETRRFQWAPKVVRYADDFIIMHQDLRAIQEAKHIAEAGLAQMG